MPAMPLQHPGRAAWAVQTGSVGENHRNVIRFLISSGGEQKSERDLRAQVQQLLRQQKVEKRQGVQSGLARGDGGSEEEVESGRKFGRAEESSCALPGCDFFFFVFTAVAKPQHDDQ